MIYLFLSILASTLVLVIFRQIAKLGANTRQSITVSYLVSAFVGYLLFSRGKLEFAEPWFWPAAIEGVVFYLVFRLMAKTAQINGIAVAGIASKMSVVIPIFIGIAFLGESANVLKVLGVITGMAAVFLSVGLGGRMLDWKWPALVFLGSGLIDASFKLFQVWSLTEEQFPAFITTVFGFAFIVGFIHHFFCVDRKVEAVSILSGCVLGVANFGTVFFILNALAKSGWESSAVYPINNFGVVAMSTVVAVGIFKERLDKQAWCGFVLAIASIGLLFLGVSSN